MNNEQSSSPFYSLVLPQFQSLIVSEAYLIEVCAVLNTCAPDRHELLMIAGEEWDASSDELESIQKQNVRIIRETGPRIATGWKQATGSVLGVLDGSVRQKPTSLKEVIEIIDEGADLAISSQYSKVTPELNTDEVGCFAIRKDCLQKIQGTESSNELLLQILGKDNYDAITQQFATHKNQSAWQNLTECFQHILTKDRP